MGVHLSAATTSAVSLPVGAPNQASAAADGNGQLAAVNGQPASTPFAQLLALLAGTDVAPEVQTPPAKRSAVESGKSDSDLNPNAPVAEQTTPLPAHASLFNLQSLVDFVQGNGQDAGGDANASQAAAQDSADGTDAGQTDLSKTPVQINTGQVQQQSSTSLPQFAASNTLQNAASNPSPANPKAVSGSFSKVVNGTTAILPETKPRAKSEVTGRSAEPRAADATAAPQTDSDAPAPVPPAHSEPAPIANPAPSAANSPTLPNVSLPPSPVSPPQQNAAANLTVEPSQPVVLPESTIAQAISSTSTTSSAQVERPSSVSFSPRPVSKPARGSTPVNHTRGDANVTFASDAPVEVWRPSSESAAAHSSAPKIASNTVQSASSSGVDQFASTVIPPGNSSPAANAGNISFAMRINPNPESQPTQQAQAPASANASSATASSPLQFATPSNPAVVSQPAEAKPLADHQTNSPEVVRTAAIEAPVASGASESRSTAQPAAPTSTTSEPTELNSTSPSSEPVRNVHVQLTGGDNQRVNLHVMDTGGELRLSVKSADPVLSQTLQDHLPELTNRLDQQRLRTEVWTPKETGGSSNSNTSNSGSFSGNANSSNSGGRQNGQQQQQQNRPEWVDELEDNPRRAQTTRRS